MLYVIEIKARSNPAFAASQLSAVESSIGSSAAGFGWGQLGLLAARKQQMADALQWFGKADRAQMNNDQWEWWARAALRGSQWDDVLRITKAMC